MHSTFGSESTLLQVIGLKCSMHQNGACDNGTKTERSMVFGFIFIFQYSKSLFISGSTLTYKWHKVADNKASYSYTAQNANL